jgi:hypothetical protein
MSFPHNPEFGFARHFVEEEFMERVRSTPSMDQRTMVQVEEDILGQFRDRSAWRLPRVLHTNREEFDARPTLVELGFTILSEEGACYVVRPPVGWIFWMNHWYPSGVSLSVQILDEKRETRLLQITNRYMNGTYLHLYEKKEKEDISWRTWTPIPRFPPFRI